MSFCALLATAVLLGVSVCDDKGVLRDADGREVAAFGVNYYTPFHTEYVETGKRGYAHKEVIRHDVAHLRRLGLNVIRLHCFDREISDRQGHLLDNRHLELLDYLIATCASNGMRTVLTPIAGWGRDEGDATNGFSFAVDRTRLSSEPVQIRIQQRYEEEFACHVNRYTGCRYADDPAILCFELVNEPVYPKDFSDQQVADYANALLDGIRRSGTKKPVFYNAAFDDGKRLGAVPLMRADGISDDCYCCGLRAGNAHPGTMLHKVEALNMKMSDERLFGKARLVYEFDAADTPGAYMYPAMARLFRSEGAQIAAQFQYESMPVADDNPSYKTHYLNLVYTPAKALSLAIAAEAFRRLPRGTPFVSNAREMVFPPFYVNAASNLSEMVTTTDYLYTATPMTLPPAPEKLLRVWGCGTSSVVASDGNGCYFLDWIASGLWRLQVYPNVLPIADPHTGLPGKKTVVLGDAPTLTVKLPDLGTVFTVWSTATGERLALASGGSFRVKPGDYVLTRDKDVSVAELTRARSADLPEYWAPLPDAADPSWRRWPPSRDELIAEAKKRATVAAKWNFLDVKKASNAHGSSVRDAQGRPAVLYYARDFVRNSSIMASVPVEGWLYQDLFPTADAGDGVVLTGRSATGRPEKVEFALVFEGGQTWGTNITLPVQEDEIRIPFSAMRYFGHWKDVPRFEAGFHPDLRRLTGIRFGIGRWLNQTDCDQPHGFVVSSVTPAEGLMICHLDFNTLQRNKTTVLSLLEKAAGAGYNAVLWEIEDKVRFDCCPGIAAPDAFSKEEFSEILAAAKRLGLEPIPLMQTFGHAEYVLKRNPYFGLREDSGRYDCYCPSKPETRRFLKALLHEYLEIFGPDVRRFHLGGDEVRSFATCPACKARKPKELYLEHLEAVAAELRARGIRPGCWHDMMLKFDQDAGGGLFGTSFKDFTVWFWDYSYPKSWHPWGQSDKPLRMLMSAGCETIICGSCQSWKEDPFLVRYGEHRENLSACAALARREKLSGFCVTSWTIHQGLKQLQQPLVQFAAKRYRDPSDDEGEDWTAAVTAAFGSVPTNALDAVSDWEVRYGLADGRGWNGYKDGTTPPKDGIAMRLKDGKTDAVRLTAELQVIIDRTAAALSQIKDMPDGELTPLGRLLIEAAELRLAFHRVEVRGLRGEDVGDIPFERTVRHYLCECPQESAERAAHIAYAYFSSPTACRVAVDDEKKDDLKEPGKRTE